MKVTNQKRRLSSVIDQNYVDPSMTSRPVRKKKTTTKSNNLITTIPSDEYQHISS